MFTRIRDDGQSNGGACVKAVLVVGINFVAGNAHRGPLVIHKEVVKRLPSLVIVPGCPFPLPFLPCRKGKL